MQLRRNHSGPGRRGIVLLVVLAMLTLFAIAGLTFVLYADAASESARINRGAESMATGGLPDMDPTAAFNLFLGQLIYGTQDDVNGTASSLRGHSLAETMYGSYDSQGAVPSDVPYNGTGRLQFTYPANTPAVANQQEYNMVNYMYFQSDGFLHDPGRYGFRTSPAAARTAPYVGGQNAPYTYPDVNSMFVATINPATGQITNPSYFRSTPVFGPLNPANPNWSSPTSALRYMTLRPRPADMGAGFLPPASATGDVQNLIGAGSSTVNDSIWIDINAPELTTANGIRYKMLVAPLILDMDSCINLNVAGNVLATASANTPNSNAHASDQGWGPWEVNMSKVLNADQSATTLGTEWQKILVGNAALSRYGSGGVPSAAATFPGANQTPHIYAQMDLNAINDSGAAMGGSTGPYTLPGPYQGFPTFPATGYGNGSAAEQTNHPMGYNPLTSTATNRVLPLTGFAPFLWAGVNASPTADLRVLCPTNYVALDATSGTTRRIHETTVLSMDPDWPGVSPYIWDSSPANAAPYTLPASQVSAPVQLYPTAPANTSQAVPPAGAPPAGSDFNATTFRSTLQTQWPSLVGRLDLNRTLTAYSPGNANPAQNAQAATDRQNFAMDIFNRLVAVTGMTATAANPNAPTVTPAQYNALRWLAQLSANIVDYIDSDDVMTAFQWTTTPQGGDNGYVFGTELPKLVVNEVYYQYNNDPTDPFTGNMATRPYKMNVWAELLNPLPAGADGNGSNQAVLQSNGTPVYQVLLTKSNTAASSSGGGYLTGLRRPENITGDPDGTGANQALNFTGTYGTEQVLGQANSFAANAAATVTVQPVGTNFASNAQGFFLLGPDPAAPSAGLPAASFQSSSLTYAIPTNDPSADNPKAPTVMLQRLANPNLPYQPNSGAASYNPYVTVDYFDPTNLGASPVNDARTFTATAKVTPAPTATNFASYGRNEPYAAVVGQWQKQAPQPASTTGPQQTFFQQNVNATTPALAPAAAPTNYPAFDWLVHLDRPLISPTELFQVSAFKPQELTQQFIDGTGTKFAHRAPWTTDQNARLYRLLEFVKVKNLMPGVMQAGRVPGKVNINTVDPNAVEVFQALADAEQGNSFYDSTGADQSVKAAFNKLTAARPFIGLAQGPYQGSDTQFPNAGIANTILPSLAATGTGTHPYQLTEMLNKLFSNLTTRSNVFAVWLTVGFFQVTNDTVQPMQLGGEINLAQGKNIRHHMFAIVDRTQVQTFSTTTTAAITANPTTPSSISIPASVTDPNTRTGRTWTVQQGSVLVYEPNSTNEETVVVGAGNTATFARNHANGVTVVSRGNPGPWIKYDSSQDGLVVPYFKIID